jgi:hypothetical protein
MRFAERQQSDPQMTQMFTDEDRRENRGGLLAREATGEQPNSLGFLSSSVNICVICG